MKSILRLFVLFGFILVIPSICSFSQVGINSDGSSPDPSAGLDVKFNNKGLLPPRMTFDQRNLIPSPADGLMVYCTNCNADGAGSLTIYQGGKWLNIIGACTTPVPTTAGTHFPSETQIVWNWNAVPIAFGYKWNTVDDYSSATDRGTSTSKTETGLLICTTYTRYVWAYNTCGHSSVCILSQATLSGGPPAPTAGTPVPSCGQIVWNWNAVPGATGYRGSGLNDYATAMELNNITSAAQPGCTPNTSYSVYIWAYNTCGHSEPVFISSQTLPGICVGLDYEGGRIFYLDGSGGGLIGSTSDQGNSLQWTKPVTSIPGTSTDIGTGQANTDAILSGCTDPNIAARICDNFSNNGFNDWFLPSKDELYQLYLQKIYFESIESSAYWSSSQYNDNDAWTQDFSTGGQSHANKGGTSHVRAVRKFFLIGDSFEGGKIFYVDGTGQHGLIAAPSDQSTGAWGCEGTPIGTTGTAIGTGQANTTAIMNLCSDPSIAAWTCHNYNGGSYTDWFLPSKDELNQMYLQKVAIGGFADFGYWSSSESSADNAWGQGLGTGPQFEAPKSSTFKVRAVRAF
jgi:Protein of unknown function (DUF1566)